MLAIAAIAPAAASAQAGGDEYTLNVPGGGNTPINGGSAGGGGGDSSSGTSSDVSPATATDTTEAPATDATTPTDTEPATGSKGSNDHVNNGDKNSERNAGQGDKPRDGLVSPDNSAPTVGPSSSDDGGVPVFLIVIAVLAAACVGFAIWRMRRSGGDGPSGGSRSTTEPGTQSL